MSFAAWQQHDVQELCRVMFDALERSWKHTDQANLITQLYQGKIKDYVKCLKVHFNTASRRFIYHLAHLKRRLLKWYFFLFESNSMNE